MIGYREALALGALAGGIGGIGEGALLAAARPFPKLLAPYKVSLDILWVAPLVDVALFSLGAVALVWIMRRGSRLWPMSDVGALSFTLALGVALVWTTALHVIHPLAALVLSLGVAAAFSRWWGRRQAPAAALLRRRWGWLAAAPLLAVALIAVGVRGHEAWQRRSDSLRDASRARTELRPGGVLVLVLDTVRADRMPGPSSQSLTPNLDRLLARGVRFDNAWSTTSWSLPSQASILTGRLPHEHGADWPDLALKPQVASLAERFAAEGWATGCFSSNAAWVVPEHLGRGFQRFEVYQLEDLLRRTVLGSKIDRILWGFGVHYAGRGKPASTLNRQFLAWLDEHGRQPWFAYLCYMDVNRTFHAKQFSGGWFRHVPSSEVIAAYDDGLRELDARIGDLLAQLEQRGGLLEHTLIVVASDHGESFGAGCGDHDPTGHGTSLYGEQLRVPLAVIPPAGLELSAPAGSRLESPVSVRQIPATIMDLLGVQGTFPGPPLVTLAEQSGVSSDEGVVSTLNYAGRESHSLVAPPWHYLRNLKPKSGEPAKALFDVERDREEKRNLAAEPAQQETIDAQDRALDVRLQRGTAP